MNQTNKGAATTHNNTIGSGAAGATAGQPIHHQASAKQKQMSPSSDLMRSFRATTNLAQGLTKERIKIQNDLQKISAGKEQLEELKNIKKVHEPMLTAEEKASKINRQEIKGTGFNLEMIQSEKGRVMIEDQRDTRRQRHIEALKECEKFVEQFYDNFAERKGEIKERVKLFFAGSDVEITRIMAGLSDELLLANEISYVNGTWEKVSQHRQARKDELRQLRQNFDDLKAFQKKGSGAHLDSMRQNLVDIAFFLAPEVDTLIKQWIQQESDRYRTEHQQNDQFYEDLSQKEAEKFDILYNQWKDSVVRFHLIKQQDAIQCFLDLMESKRYVNPQTRVDIFNRLKQEQMRVFNQRMEYIRQIDSTASNKLSKDFITQIDDKLRSLNDDAQTIFDEIVVALNRDMENTNEDADIAIYDLKDFLTKNDAQLEEGQTFDSIVAEQAAPTVERRKLEAKTLILNAVKYMEDFDFKMNEICNAIIAFFRDLATKIDANKERLKQTEITFQVSLAQCGDHHDELASAQEDDLGLKVQEMRRAIHHVELNDKLQQCFDLLDSITRTYRTYNVEYMKIVDAHPQTMNSFFVSFERECMTSFKMFEEARREEILALFTRETQEKQAKLEEEAMRKYEEDKKMEEMKRIEEEKKNPAAAAGAKGKAPPPPAKKPAGKAGEPEKPVIDVPKLEVPKIGDWTAPISGNKYLVERTITELAVKIMDAPALALESLGSLPVVETGDPTTQAAVGGASSTIVNSNPSANMPPGGSTVTTGSLVLGEDGQPIVEQPPPPKFKPNDYLDKASLLPPQDPTAAPCLHKDLLIQVDEVKRILTGARDRCIEWLNESKGQYGKKVEREGKELKDKNVDELDENLRKQWPRKGRLEVEIYQERKSQITAHNKKYERTVRACLEKCNMLEEQWEYVVENIQRDFGSHRTHQDRLRGQLPDGKNLAELQGVQRKEKDQCQTFEEKCRDYQDKLYDMAITQPEVLVGQNNDMLGSCSLFESGGNYSKEEIEWYRGQMTEINEMIQKTKSERDAKMKELNTEMEKLMKEPFEQFEKDYKGSIHNLSAKEGLGKTYGQPRRLAQEKLRGEMTKCEQAQKGIEALIDKVNKLCEKANNLEFYHENFDYAKEKQTLSMEIRVTMVSLVRCFFFYGQHLGAFLKEPKQLSRLSYLEKQAEVELTASEQGVTDEKRKDEELENLGPLGFKNTTQAYFKFQDMLGTIEKQSKDLCQKLYTGETAKYLVGPEKIPEYLSNFIEVMRRQSEDFRLGSVRQLREAASTLVKVCQIIPQAALGYLSKKYTRLIERSIETENRRFRKVKSEDDERKEKHLKWFRPNLENPANKGATLELNVKEGERTEKFKEVIDDTQLKMLDIEQELSLEFQNAYLNNVRGLIKVYDCLLYKEDFIMLPGDEIVEKKHQNIRTLTAQAQKQDLGKRSTRKWPGLGASVFDIDMAALFDQQFKEFKDPNENANAAATQAVTNASVVSNGPVNELAQDIEVQNTDHHKQIIKARNEYYNSFKFRFETSVKGIASRFDALRKEELRFNGYWASNLKEITQKHI